MSKPFTEDDLANQLNQDITWRIKEISDIKTAVRSADGAAKPALLRAMVTISYAHWEGHIRFSAQKFLFHIALRRIYFSALDRQFIRNHFLPRLADLHRKSLEERGNFIDAVQSAGGERYAKVNERLIDTRANLSSHVLTEICQVCGVDPKLFAPRETFIDVFLLKRRNSVAHGEDTLIGFEELDELANGTIEIMRIFSNELQTSAYLRRYMAA